MKPQSENYKTNSRKRLIKRIKNKINFMKQLKKLNLLKIKFIS